MTEIFQCPQRFFTFKESYALTFVKSEDVWPSGNIQTKERLGRKYHSLGTSVLCVVDFTEEIGNGRWG